MNKNTQDATDRLKNRLIYQLLTKKGPWWGPFLVEVVGVELLLYECICIRNNLIKM